MDPKIIEICGRVEAEAWRIGLPVKVMYITRRLPGHADRWATPPTARIAVGYLTTTDPTVAAGQLVDDWCDAQTGAGRTVTDDERARLTAAATAAVTQVTS